MTDLDTLGSPDSTARSINAKGQITGECSMRAGDQKAFLYENGAMRDLDSLISGMSSAGRVIDAFGRVYGYTNDSSGDVHMAYFDNGGWTLINPEVHPGTDVVGVNSHGDILANYDGGSPNQHGIVVSNGAITHLGVLNIALGGSNVDAINDLGQIVGSSPLQDGSRRAVLYENSVPIDLNSLIPSGSGWTLEYATSINDQGQIVGIGTSPDSIDRAFLLTPVPEPMTLSVMALGGFWFLLRKPSLLK
jgi:probable HAF family extracellular repeat protein